MPLKTGATPGCRAIFLDRDGTLIVHKPYLHRAEEVALLPTVREALALARSRGCRLYLFSNQSGVGRNWFTMKDVEAVNARLVALLGLGEDVFAGVCVATEVKLEPGGYRKPSPRYILETCEREGWSPAEVGMIGDMPTDWDAGLAAGARVAAVPADPEHADNREALATSGVPLHDTLLMAVTALLSGVHTTNKTS